MLAAVEKPCQSRVGILRRAVSGKIPPAEDLVNVIDALFVANPTADQLVQPQTALSITTATSAIRREMIP